MKITLPAFPVSGGCACGACRYEVWAAPIGVFACCCADCQKLTGSAFSLAMPLMREAFAMTKGEPATWDRVADSGRVIPQRYCPDCGARLFTEPPRGPQTVTLRPGTLDDTRWLVPAAAFYMSSAQPWTAFPDGTLLYDREPDDFGAVVRAWRGMVG